MVQSAAIRVAAPDIEEETMKPLISLLLLTMCAVAQNLNVPDHSASGSPISFTQAKIEQGPAGQRCALEIYNNSGHGLVAYLVRFDMATPEGKKYTAFSTHDHTLSNATPALSTMQAVHISCVKGSPTGVKVLYAGFDDGTHWGNADAVAFMQMQHDLIVNQHLDMGQAHVRLGRLVSSGQLKLQ
jgi:hypothetical protein